MSACGHVETTEVEKESHADNGTFELRYEYGVVDSYAAIMNSLGEEASQLCPQGWQKTKELHEPQGAGLAPVYIWEIQCAEED